VNAHSAPCLDLELICGVPGLQGADRFLLVLHKCYLVNVILVYKTSFVELCDSSKILESKKWISVGFYRIWSVFSKTDGIGLRRFFSVRRLFKHWVEDVEE
jgi:hypothetical protein